MEKYLLFFIGMNNVCHFVEIRREHRQVTADDAMLLLWETIVITLSLVTAQLIYRALG